MQRYITSDLVMETSFSEKIKNIVKTSPKAYTEENFGDIRVCRVEISNAEEAQKCGCGIGRHISLFTPKLWCLDDGQGDRLLCVLSDELDSMLDFILNGDKSQGKTFLVAGIGNRHLAPDALGVRTAEKVSTTRQISVTQDKGMKNESIPLVCTVCNGVFGETGVSTLELLRGTVREIRPDAVIAIDALASRSTERLAATIQISSGGISPGAGIGNRQSAVSAQTLGVPVIAIGVPTVISAATLVADTLEKYQNVTPQGELKELLDGARSMFVTPKECDIITECVSSLLSRALNTVFGVI